MCATGFGSTASVATTLTVTGISWWSGGQRMLRGEVVMLTIVGGVVSRTVTVNEPVAVLPWVSVAVQFTVVVPSANVEPLAGVHSTATLPETRSVAVAVNVTAAPLGLVASAVMFAGSVRTGGVVSCTVTWTVAVPVLCCESVALHVTNVVPTANVEPLAGEQTTGRGPSASSEAAAVNVTTAPLGPVASTTMSSGTTTFGGVVSPTVTLKEPVTVLPAE